MKRTLLAVLGLALVASAASAADNFDCRKAKAASFAGSTAASISDGFGTQTGVAIKKPFLYCDAASLNGGPSSTDKQVCYKIKGAKVADGARSTTDAFGALSLSVKGKTFVFCTPAS